MTEEKIVREIAEGYFYSLIHQDGDQFLEILGDSATIKDPRAGSIAIGDARAFHSEIQDWVKDWNAQVQFLRTTQADGRTCCESMLHLELEGEKLSLPVAVLVCGTLDTDALELHVYYTQWPFNKSHSTRPALYNDPSASVEHKGYVKKFFSSLRSGDLEGALGCFEADIYMREASGPPYVHWGHAAVANYLKGLFSDGAPMIRGDTLTDDGRCAVMEFTVFGWDGTPWEDDRHQAGLAIYERSEEGLIRAIRIYDDVEF